MPQNALNTAHDSILCLVDIQPRLLSSMDEDEQQALIKNTEILLKAASALGIPVVISEQYPHGLGTTHEALIELAADAPLIEKTVFSCHSNADWKQTVDSLDRRQLVIVGIEAHICVLQTAIEAKASGYTVSVVEDAIASRSFNNKFNAVARMRQHGVQISNAESVLFEWMKDASHPAFKQLSQLI